MIKLKFFMNFSNLKLPPICPKIIFIGYKRGIILNLYSYSTE